MKKLGLAIVAMIFIGEIRAQVGVVTVPALEVESKVQTGILGSIQASSFALEEAQKKAEKLYKSVDWIWNLGAFEDFLSMMEGVSCTTSDVQSNLNVVLSLDIGNTCWQEYKYEKSINNLKLALDITNMILDAGLQLQNGDRGSMIRDAVEKYNEAQEDLYDLNVDLLELINNKIHNDKQIDGYKSLAKMERKY